MASYTIRREQELAAPSIGNHGIGHVPTTTRVRAAGCCIIDHLGSFAGFASETVVTALRAT